MVTAPPGADLNDAAELGAVDDRSVRVWVRRVGAEEVTATLHVVGRPDITVSTSLSPDTDWTGAVVLRLAEPASRHPFACTVGQHRLHGRFAPSHDDRARLTFGFGSCHLPFAAGRGGEIATHRGADLYPAMLRELKAAEASLLLLVGDQMYSDALPGLSVRDHLAAGAAAPPPPAAMVDEYRRIARRFFGQPGMKALRESFPTSCIWDDHDIFNDWGSTLHESELDRRLFAAASRVYCEYQHLRHPGGAIGPPPYGYAFRYGTIGFLVLDLRGARDYESGRLLGRAQWERVRSYLDGPDTASIETLFVVASVPIAHVSRWLTLFLGRLGESAANDVRDRWCAPAFVASRDELLADLITWQTSRPHRQVVILSGDVHCASAFTIRDRRGRGRLRQVTSSALTTPLSWQQMALNGAATRFPNALEPRYRFDRHFLSLTNNFGLVRLDPLPAGGHRVEIAIRAWHRRTRTLRDAGRLISIAASG